MSIAAEIYTPPAAESKALAIMATLTPMMVFGEAGPEPIIEKIRKEVFAAPVDISTTKGREAVASLAYKIARSKTALDDMGKQLVAEWKSKSSAVDAERKRIRDSLDALKDDFRKPLTDWENAEKDRVTAHEAALAIIPESANYGQTETAAEFRERLDFLLNYPVRDWEEFSDRATKALESEIARTRLLLATAEQREAERAELERLRQAEAVRLQQERDDRLRTEAAEAARREAEAIAAREASAVAEAAERERKQIEAERQAAEDTARQAERDRGAAEERAAQAVRDREAAVETERKRVAEVARLEEKAAADREANKRHRAKVNNEVLAALVAAGLSEKAGTAAITAIARGEVPHVKISY